MIALARITLSIFVFALPFGAFHLSTIAAVLLVVVGGTLLRQQFDVRHLFFVYERRWMFVALFAFLFFVTISLAFASSLSLAIFATARLLLAIVAGASAAYVIGRGLVTLDFVFGAIVASAVFQSIVAFLQFASQSSLGLWWLGESVLSSDAPGVAKIVVEGVRFIRAYGTFPHPNVLAAFLLVGLVALAFLFFKKTSRFLLPTFYFLLLLGLLLTFSRAAWIICVLLFVVIAWWAMRYREQGTGYRGQWVLTILGSLVVLVTIFYPFIFARSSLSLDEPAIADRIQYLRLGVDIVVRRPFGVGIGNQVLYATQHDLYGAAGLLAPWQREPIHNLYLLIASEIGVFGLIAFCMLIGAVFMVKSETLKVERFFVALMLGALLLFGFTDHFLWDVAPGRLLLWFLIGLALA